MAQNDRGSKNVIIYNESGVTVGDAITPIVVYEIDTAKATYSAAFAGLVAVASPTDVFTITGSASKTIRITRIALTVNLTAVVQRDVLIIKRSAANTGGTSTTATNVPHDSTFAAGTATVRGYTANPSALGAAVGTIRARKTMFTQAATTAVTDEFVTDFGTRHGSPIVLRGVAEVLAVNFNGVTATGNTCDFSIEWTEE